MRLDTALMPSNSSLGVAFHLLEHWLKVRLHNVERLAD